jgi:hypothetical protein
MGYSQTECLNAWLDKSWVQLWTLKMHDFKDVI